ncbi:MAG TPA: hypothetical protein VF988_16215 [Verrucomicrobiae bacterium]
MKKPLLPSWKKRGRRWKRERDERERHNCGPNGEGGVGQPPARQQPGEEPWKAFGSPAVVSLIKMMSLR